MLLIFTSLPSDRENLKEHAPHRIAIGGAQVAEQAIARAFLRHGNFDEVWFLTPPLGRDSGERLTRAPSDPRVRIRRPDQLPREHKEAILFHSSHRLFEAAALRRHCGCAPPPQGRPVRPRRARNALRPATDGRA